MRLFISHKMDNPVHLNWHSIRTKRQRTKVRSGEKSHDQQEYTRCSTVKTYNKQVRIPKKIPFEQNKIIEFIRTEPLDCLKPIINNCWTSIVIGCRCIICLNKQNFHNLWDILFCFDQNNRQVNCSHQLKQKKTIAK